MKKRFPHFLNKLWLILASVIILAALLVSIASLLTPVLNEHRQQIENIATSLLKAPVQIQEMKITWHGYEPQLSLQQVTVFDPEGHGVKIVMKQLDIDFDLWRSLFSRKVTVENFTVSGVDLTITQSVDNEIQIGNILKINLRDLTENKSDDADTMTNWIFTQPGFVLQDFKLHFILPQKEHLVTLKRLSLINKSNSHIIDGQATLNQEVPTYIKIKLNWIGDIKNLKAADGHCYLELQHFSLPQWLGNQTWRGFRLIEGLANAKIWLDWNQNHLYQMKSDLAISGLDLYSTIKKQHEMINYIIANLDWEHEGSKYFITGKKILLATPVSSWPETQFIASAVDDGQGGIVFDHMQFNFINLTDVFRILLASDVLSDAQRKILETLQLEGEMQDVDATIPGSFTDFEHIVLKGKVNNFSMMPWETFPGVKHLTGILNWNGNKGNIAINSKQFSLIISQLFKRPLFFDVAHSNFNFSRSAAGDWLFDTPNLHLDNKDITVDSQLVFSIPAQNNIATTSPTMNNNVSNDAVTSVNATPVANNAAIDLQANFILKNAAHVAYYLPLKKFEPELERWLQNAFVQGRAEGGKVELKGRLVDFPFDAIPHSGKFLVTAALKDIDFNYAPNWPHIKNINGQLTFSGSTMTADIASGKILDIPIANVHGVIPYIGENAPQILNVTALLQADASSGMNFIQQSPLRETIGKELAAMQLSGPMQLKLGLEVPLKKPEDTRVSGDVLLSDANLVLPAWQLQFSHINGQFNFTEDSIESKEMRGEILGAEAILQMTTLHEPGKKGQVRADLSSAINISSLQEWLKIDLSNIAKGVAPYQVQLFLSNPAEKSSQQDRLIFSSNLKGINLNLPNPYGKQVDEEKNLEISIALGDPKIINTEIDYAKLVNALLSFRKGKQNFEFFGGEIQLGGKPAARSNTAGVMIRGEIPELDVPTWQKYFATFQEGSNRDQAFSWKLFRGIDIKTNVIKALGTELHRASLFAEIGDYAWHVKIDSTEISGDLMLPLKWGEGEIEGHLEKLHIVSANVTDSQQLLDARSIPAMNLDIANVDYNDMHFGHVFLMLAPSRTGLTIKQFGIDEPTLKLKGEGEWIQNKNQSSTRLSGSMQAPNIGDVLTQWGFNSSNLVGSTGNVTFDLGWPAPPYQPSLSSLTGKLNIKLGEGRIINLSESTNSKMGLGRLLNILSLSSIPRRLSLDFSDVFEQGYSFDTMEGDLTFKNGNALVDTVRFEGPVAGVILKGRIGVVARDLNIQLGVAPHVTGSLPVVVAIAGGPVVGPAVGLATWLVDEVVSHQSKKTSKYEYVITGPWDNPVWHKLDAYGRPIPN